MTKKLMSLRAEGAAISPLCTLAPMQWDCFVVSLLAMTPQKKQDSCVYFPRKSYKETAPHIIKEIKMLHRKPRGIQKRKTFKEVAEILNEKGFTTSSDKPFTAMNVHKIIKRQG